MALSLWSLGFLLRQTTGLDALDGYARTLLRIQATGIIGTAAGFFTFAVVVLKPEGRFVRLVAAVLPVALAIGMGLIWLGDAVMLNGEDQLIENSTWRIVLGGALAYAVLAFWTVLSSRSYNAPMLRIPTALGVTGIGLLWFTGPEPLPPGILICGAGTLYVGQALLRRQVRTPVEELNAELRIANRDLQQVINDLAAEKEKSDVLNRELREANRYKSEFLANISHELRTPLNSILGYSELLRTGVYGGLSEKQLDRMEKIHRNGSDLLALITDILDLNKIDAGQMTLDVEPFDVADVMTKLRDEYSRRIEGKPLTLEVNPGENLPYLYGDARRIHQILDNLADNAIKFTHEGQITITSQRVDVVNGISDAFKLPARGWLHDGVWVVIRITDTGIGIPVEEQGRIFSEFAQVDGSHTREFGGTGMGLAISKRLVEMHDGVIWLDSVVDQGSTFYVALPADFRGQPDQTGTSGLPEVSRQA
jgi:signal transduction histidine kinase